MHLSIHSFIKLIISYSRQINIKTLRLLETFNVHPFRQFVYSILPNCKSANCGWWIGKLKYGNTLKKKKQTTRSSSLWKLLLVSQKRFCSIPLFFLLEPIKFPLNSLKCKINRFFLNIFFVMVDNQIQTIFQVMYCKQFSISHLI